MERSPSWWRVGVIVAGAAALASCRVGTHSPHVAPPPAATGGEATPKGATTVTTAPSSAAPAPATTSVASPRSPALDGDRRRRADQLISAFENSTTVIRYDYAEDIGDGRGITSGRAGFTTATCDGRDVVDRYTAVAPGNGLVRFLPELRRLCDAGSATTSGLPAAAYIAAWAAAAADPRFRSAQDAIVESQYFAPAMAAADALGLRSPLARAELYDTAIQEGTDDDRDALGSVIARTTARVGTPAAVGEAVWLDHYFTERISTLRNPSTGQSAAWAATIDRVECMRRLAKAGHAELDGPFHFTVYGDEFTTT